MDSATDAELSHRTETLWLRTSAIDDRKNSVGNKNDTEYERPPVLEGVGGNSRRAGVLPPHTSQLREHGNIFSNRVKEKSEALEKRERTGTEIWTRLVAGWMYIQDKNAVATRGVPLLAKKSKGGSITASTGGFHICSKSARKACHT